MEKNLRINSIELRTINGEMEIVKWMPNDLYNKQDEFEFVESGPHAKMYKHKKSEYYVSAELFKIPESCYVLYIVEDQDEEPDLLSVGSRPFTLDKDDKYDLQEIINYLYDI